MYKTNDYRVVVGIDFGTTYSGFAYAHKKNPQEIIVHIDWQEYSGRFKTPTALSYDEGYRNVQSWGFPALAKRPKKRRESERKPVELFKLHLGKMTNKPPLPKGFDYKKAITDYLTEMGKVIKRTITDRWDIDFFTQVLIVLTIPAEFDDKAMVTIRECVYKAGLLMDRFSRNLKFTTEPEAAAVHCMKSLKEHNFSIGATFMVVDCGGGTVDLTTRKLMDGERLSEITERSGDFCGGSYVDQEFLKFLGHKVGPSAIKLVKENQYGQLQFMVQEFCRLIKMKFTGVQSEFHPIELELDEICPALMQYCKGEYLDNMEGVDWSIKLKYKDVKAMFDPVIDKIIRLIYSQLSSNDKCSALILVGGFSESKYLQSRVRQEFSKKVQVISIPPQPVTAIIKGAVQYGLREEVVFDRVLKWTYGTDVTRKWRQGDPVNRRNEDNRIIVFKKLAERGAQIAVDEKVTETFHPYSPTQRSMGLDLYITPKADANFCDESNVKLHGKWGVNLPLTGNRSILYNLTFGAVEIGVTAYNPVIGECKTTFELDL
ncbi:hypothetical protein C1645_835959 [Glomus cerebriforme]|uniref:Actin-like ATPase domain-containing protein n=1 Tax=Glomus cerebriforme TaxID=658196 RepID=A0A397S7X6_9GLOM|nr:hypothetical protein C1645_835959 [Glomus cerebriforme]